MAIYLATIGSKHLIPMGILMVIITALIVAIHGMMIMHHQAINSRLTLNNMLIMMAMDTVITHRTSSVVTPVSLIMGPLTWID